MWTTGATVSTASVTLLTAAPRLLAASFAFTCSVWSPSVSPEAAYVPVSAAVSCEVHGPNTPPSNAHWKPSPGLSVVVVPESLVAWKLKVIEVEPVRPPTTGESKVAPGATVSVVAFVTAEAARSTASFPEVSTTGLSPCVGCV